MMDINFTIAGFDRTGDVSVDWSIEQVLTHEEDACSLLIISGEKPAAGEELVITYGTDKLFAGIIDTVKEDYKTGKITFYKCSARDYSYLIDKRLVVETYQNQSADNIFKDIAAKYAWGFSDSHVEPGAPQVERISFNYKRPSDCFKELCEYVGWDWFVDYNKDLHFFNPAKLAEQAPIVVDNGSKVRKIKHDIDTATLRNRVYVLGSTMLSDPQTVQWKADGVARIWTLPWNPHEMSLTVGEITKTVGIENVHEEADYDYLLNSKEKYLRCSEQTTTPVEGTTMSLIAKQDIDVITMVEDLESQAAIALVQGGDGVYEHSVADDSLTTIEAAEAAGMADLRQHANPRVKGSFETEVSGWQPGQLVDIRIPDKNLYGTYLVQKVTISPVASDMLSYKVEYGGRLLGIADFLKALVSSQQNKKMSETTILHKFAYGTDQALARDELEANLRTPPWEVEGSQEFKMDGSQYEFTTIGSLLSLSYPGFWSNSEYQTSMDSLSWTDWKTISDIKAIQIPYPGYVRLKAGGQTQIYNWKRPLAETDAVCGFVFVG